MIEDNMFGKMPLNIVLIKTPVIQHGDLETVEFTSEIQIYKENYNLCNTHCTNYAYK